MKKGVIGIVVIDIFVLCTVMLSYYLKKHIGYVFYNWLMILFIIAFVLFSFALILTRKKASIYIGQILCCIFLFFMMKLDLPDRFALLAEVPKFEAKIEGIKGQMLSDGALAIYDDYIISDWEPGFLDYQWVLVYDENDSLQYITDSKKIISEGKLYILYRAKKCFYLCILRR